MIEFTAAVAVELDRLVPAVHRGSARPQVRAPHLWLLADVASLLAHGPAPLQAVLNVHRYEAGQDLALDELARDGWLWITDEVAATSRCLPLLREINEAHADAAARLWPEPVALDITVDHPFTAAVTGTAPAARLFDQLRALRYHRADAHAAAWQAEGLTVEGVRGLAADDPVRVRIEEATNRLASAPYRALSPTVREALLASLRALPPH